MQDGYLEGYMYKHGGLGSIAEAVAEPTAALMGTGVETSADVLKAVLPFFVALPLVVGGAAGAAHSKLTSPTPMDIETAQSAMTAAELDEMLASMRRRKIKSSVTPKEKPRERSLHI